MNRKIITLSLILNFCMIAVVLTKIVYSTDSEWSFSIENNIERSVRKYLLVNVPSTEEDREATYIDVVSQCEKERISEPKYGECSHFVNVYPTNVNFTLNTGEDVVMIMSDRNFQTIIATIKYGCCDSPDTVAFYTIAGKYLGTIEKYDTSKQAYSDNLITRTFNMNNLAHFNNKSYILVDAKDKKTLFKAVVFGDGKELKTIPVQISSPTVKIDEDWQIDKFITYGENKDIALKLGNSHEGLEQLFSCSVSEDALNCKISPNKTNGAKK